MLKSLITTTLFSTLMIGSACAQTSAKPAELYSAGIKTGTVSNPIYATSVAQASSGVGITSASPIELYSAGIRIGTKTNPLNIFLTNGGSGGGSSDLSEYLKTADFDTQIANYATLTNLSSYALKTDVPNVTNYYTKAQADSSAYNQAAQYNASYVNSKYITCLAISSGGIMSFNDNMLNTYSSCATVYQRPANTNGYNTWSNNYNLEFDSQQDNTKGGLSFNVVDFSSTHKLPMSFSGSYKLGRVLFVRGVRTESNATGSPFFIVMIASSTGTELTCWTALNGEPIVGYTK